MDKSTDAPLHVGLMGAQGSGKGTQAAVLAPRLHLIHLSTGDLFRATIASGSQLGQELKAILDRGDLVPDELTLRMVAARLDEIKHLESGGKPARGALFDGFPRTAGQAEGLEAMLTARGERLGAVILIEVPLDVLVTRLSGRRLCPNGHGPYHVIFNPPRHDEVCDVCGATLYQRDDDKPEAIQRRLDLYFSQTEPLIAYFRERGLLTAIDGNQAVDGVTSDIVAALADRGVVADRPSIEEAS